MPAARPTPRRRRDQPSGARDRASGYDGQPSPGRHLEPERVMFEAEFLRRRRNRLPMVVAALAILVFASGLGFAYAGVNPASGISTLLGGGASASPSGSASASEIAVASGAPGFASAPAGSSGPEGSGGPRLGRTGAVGEREPSGPIRLGCRLDGVAGGCRSFSRRPQGPSPMAVARRRSSR